MAITNETLKIVNKGVYDTRKYIEQLETLSKKLVKCYIWSVTFYGAEIWTLKSRSEVPGKFSNVVLQKNGEDQLARSYEKLGSIT